MRIAKLGLKSETVAFLGIKAASEAITVAYPDPFAEKSDEDRREFMIFMLFGIKSGAGPEFVVGYNEWLARQGWKSPSEWIGETGDNWRKLWGMKPTSDDDKAAWTEFRDGYAEATAAEVKAMLEATS